MTAKIARKELMKMTDFYLLYSVNLLLKIDYDNFVFKHSSKKFIENEKLFFYLYNVHLVLLQVIKRMKLGFAIYSLILA